MSPHAEFVALIEELKQRENMWLAYGFQIYENQPRSKAVRELLKHQERARFGFDDADTRSAKRVIAILIAMYVKRTDADWVRSAERQAARRATNASGQTGSAAKADNDDMVATQTGIASKKSEPEQSVRKEEAPAQSTPQIQSKSPSVLQQTPRNTGFER